MKKAIHIILPLILVIAILASIGWYLFVYDRDFTRDMLLGQARYHTDNGNPDLASWFYNLAYNYAAQDEDIAIELANQYKADGNYTKAEFTLTNAIADGGTADLYIALSKTYVEQDKLLDAVNMLSSISNPQIRAQLDALRPAAPTADREPGFHSEYLSVQLTAAQGSLYATIDGRFPSTGRDACTGPIDLAEGETTILALAVADNGLVSPIADFIFTIGGIVEEVHFADPAMEAAIRSLLEARENDVIMTNALWDITEFTVPAEAASFEDLKYLPYLQKLTLQEKQLVNLDILKPLEHLEAVDLSGCRFPAEALSVAASLPKLKRLNLDNCGLSTIADLADAKGLTHLYLSGNTLRNLTALEDMKSLVELTLDNNAVVDLDILGKLPHLQKLDISHNAVTSLAPLAGCKKLTWLAAGNNAIADLDTVDQLPELTHLELNNNQLTDITLLGSCTGLKELDISANLLEDITALATLNALEEFNFSHNQVKVLPAWGKEGKLRRIDGSHNLLESIDSLADQQELSYVYMDYNKLKSVTALADCYHLVLVNVYGNEIKDVSALTDRDIIVNYDPT